MEKRIDLKDVFTRNVAFAVVLEFNGVKQKEECELRDIVADMYELFSRPLSFGEEGRLRVELVRMKKSLFIELSRQPNRNNAHVVLKGEKFEELKKEVLAWK